jgi:outer membrane protein OmpA-like peptidoglycan-associated protein
VSLRPGLAALALALAGCANLAGLRAQAEAIRAEADAARVGAGLRCAPRELALADAHVEFALREIADGDPGRAEEHLGVAAANAQKATSLARACQQAAVKDLPPPRIVKKVQDSDGDGIPDDIDRCPRDPEDKDGFQDEDGCPDPDNDGDGIVDAMDACPDNPGPLENRGCPVLDRDGDGVPDPDDRCPDQPGPRQAGGCPDRDGDGIPDQDDRCPDVPGFPPDGCPRKYALVEVRQDRIEIRQPVKFASARYAVLPASWPLLDQVVRALLDQPRIRLRIEGHTDSVGAEAANRKLSQRRADSVKAYLIRKGIEPARLEAVGHGSERPVASNRTAKGKTQNRRTEFHIVWRE